MSREEFKYKPTPADALIPPSKDEKEGVLRTKGDSTPSVEPYYAIPHSLHAVDLSASLRNVSASPLASFVTPFRKIRPTEYDPTIIVYDKVSKKWKLVKKSQNIS